MYYKIPENLRNVVLEFIANAKGTHFSYAETNNLVKQLATLPTLPTIEIPPKKKVKEGKKEKKARKKKKIKGDKFK